MTGLESQQIIITLSVVIPCVIVLIMMGGSRGGNESKDPILQLSRQIGKIVWQIKRKKKEVEELDREVDRLNAEIKELMEDKKGGE